MNASPSPFSAHSDVLEATVPDDAAGKERLLTELKNRGKAAVTGGAWPDAQALYEKALQCTSDDNNNQKAILYSNISLVQGKMNHWPEAKQSASQAVQADPAYTKGWWRLGQAHAALEKYDEAVKALSEASNREPSNKALQKELTKQQENAKKAAAARAEKEAAEKAKQDAAKEEASLEKSTTKTKPTPASSKKSSSSSASSKPEPMQVDDEEESSTFTKSDHVKGYKIVNGKKTSYFHNELSDEAKALIGDIAPKKLDATPELVPPDSENKGTSAWNKAGEYSEKEMKRFPHLFALTLVLYH